MKNTSRAAIFLAIATLAFGCGGSDGGTDPGKPDAVDPGTDTAVMEVTESGMADPGVDIPPDPLLPDWVKGEGGGAFLAQCAGSDLRIAALDDGILRLLYVDQAPDQPDHSYAVVDQGWGDVTLTYGHKGDVDFFLQTPRMRLEILREAGEGGCRVKVLAGEGDPSQWTVILEDPASDAWERGNDPGKVSLTRTTAADEHFYGFGEKTGPLDKRGETLTFYNTDPLAGGIFNDSTDPIYQFIPFFVGLRGDVAYGVFTDNTFRMEFDMGAADPGLYRITAHGGRIDQYVIAGPHMADVLRRYTRLTGRMPMPPRWTLGFHQCRWSYYPDTRVLEIANEFRKRKIPADGIWLDIDYMDGYRSWTFDPKRFPDPEGMIDQLEDIHFKTTVIIDPGIKEDPGWDVYDQGVAGGHFLKTADGKPFVGFVWPGPAVFPDFSSASARAWWATQVPRVLDKGVRGIWIDMNEPASFLPDDGFTVPDDVQADGDGRPTTMAEVHNVFALNMAHATWNGMLAAAPHRRPFVLTRSGFAGEQRWAALWTGDVPSEWPMLRNTLPMLMNIGLSGVAFTGSDVGGFSGGPGPEMFARWMQVGAISPFFRDHVQTGAPDQEPWAFGVEVEDISRRMITERYVLLPYIYSLFREAHVKGAPILRPLVYEFQGEPAVRNIEDQAMLGPWLLYAPVMEEGVETRSIYLPDGTWYERYSGREYVGPATIEPALPLGALPTYVREGAILPGSQAMQWSDQEPVNPLTLELFPADHETSFTLYEDDGESMAYQGGAYSDVDYTLVRTAGGARFTAGPREGSFTPEGAFRYLLIRVRRVDGPPTSVELDGEGLAAVADLDAIMNNAKGWWFDVDDQALWVNIVDRDDFVLDMTYPTDGASSETVPMQFSVDVPAGTPKDAPVHIVGSWSAWEDQQPLDWVAGQDKAWGVIQVPRGLWFHYKYTRGGWDTVEKWADCVEADNRYTQGLVHPTKLDTVEAWADQCRQ